MQKTNISDIQKVIQILENCIENGSVTPHLLTKMQQWVDAADIAWQGHPEFDAYYPHLLELQALIYFQNDQDNKGYAFLNEALSLLGDSSRLSSYFLQTVPSQGHQAQLEPAFEPDWEPPVSEEPYQPYESEPLDFKKRSWGKKPLVIIGATGMFLLVLTGSLVLGDTVLNPKVRAQKLTVDSLTTQYETCAKKLNTLRNSIDLKDSDAVDSFNAEQTKCQDIKNRQDKAIDQYNALIGESPKPKQNQDPV